jgi:S1-C subfamily serine protease
VIGDSHLEGKGIALMLVVGVGAVALARWGHYLGRVDGVILLGLYVSAMVILGAGGRQDESASPNERSVSIRTTGCGHVSKTRGSGVAVGGDLVVTVAHVVVGALNRSCHHSRQRRAPGSIVALDARRDLALFQFPAWTPPRWSGRRFNSRLGPNRWRCSLRDRRTLTSGAAYQSL